MSSEITNTTVTFTASELDTIESDGNEALREIQQAATQGQPAPVGVWSQMYKDVLSVMNSEGIQGGQAYWFQQASSINAAKLSDPAGYFVRDITALGFGVSLSDPKLQQISDAIGQNIYTSINENIQNGGSSLSFVEQLEDDIGTAIDDRRFNLPIGSWGGSFYYWNLPYIQGSGLTVGDAIEADSQQTQIFVTNTAQAMTDTFNALGLNVLADSSSIQAFVQGFKNLATDNAESVLIGVELLDQLEVDMGVGSFLQVLPILEGNGVGNALLVSPYSASLAAGNGPDALIGGQVLGSVENDTLIGGSGTDLFVFSLPSSGSATETINDADGLGEIALASSGQVTTLGGAGSQPLAAVQGTPDTWEDSSGALYAYDSATQDLTISGGDLGSGNQIVVDDFNIEAATGIADGSAGDLGLQFTDQIDLVAGSTDGSDPPSTDFAAGGTQSYTASVDAPSSSAQTVTITLSGAPAADFSLVSGTSVIPLNADGTFTVTIPAGQTSASFTLANTADVGGNATLQLTASLAYGNTTLSSGALSQNFDESTSSDPFSTPAAVPLYSDFISSISPDNVQYDVISDSTNYDGGPQTPIGSSPGSGNEAITATGNDEAINGGTGSDLINADFGGSIIYFNIDSGQESFSTAAPGTDEIVGNGGADFISDTTIGPQTDVEIYADQVTDLESAIQAAQAPTATDQPGDVITTGVLYLPNPGEPAGPNNQAIEGEPAGTTIVGGTGNDLIVNGQADAVVVAGSGDDTIAGGIWLDGVANVGDYYAGPWRVSSATPDSLVVNNLIS